MNGYQDWLPLRGRWLRYALGILLIHSAVLLLALAHGWPPFRLALLPSLLGSILGGLLAFGGCMLVLTTPGRPGVPVPAATGATLALLQSLAVINWCTELGVHYLHELHGPCGTERAMVLALLSLPVPAALLLVGLAWWHARDFPVANTLARNSACAALAVWLLLRLILPSLG